MPHAEFSVLPSLGIVSTIGISLPGATDPPAYLLARWDTGAEKSIVDWGVLTKLGLKVEPFTSSKINLSLMWNDDTVFTYHDLEVQAAHFHMDHKNIQAFLGRDVLSKLRLTYDGVAGMCRIELA